MPREPSRWRFRAQGTRFDEVVFDALDEIIRIIRKSEGKADSAEKIMKRFALDAEQTDAMLQAKPGNLRFQLRAIRSLADNQQPEIGQLLHCFDRTMVPLALDQIAH